MKFFFSEINKYLPYLRERLIVEDCRREFERLVVQNWCDFATSKDQKLLPSVQPSEIL